MTDDPAAPAETASPPPAPGLLARAAVLMVRGYQLTLSRCLPPVCRFEPSCSQYMIDALRAHGLIRGLALGAWRLLRCHPWGGEGHDPVPPPRRRD